MDRTPGQIADSQSKRRVKYGLNVAVVILVAISLAVLVNWIGYRQFFRRDYTHGRKYSLSDQTRKVLDKLDGDYKLVSILPPSRRVSDPRLGSIIDQAVDVTDEYDRRSRDITVEHLDPTTNVTRIESFYESLRARYDDQLEPLSQAIGQSREVIAEVRSEAGALIEPVQKLSEHPELADGELQQFLRSVAQTFVRLGPDLKSLDSRVEKAVDHKLPNYDAARSTLTNLLRDLDESVFALAVGEFRKFADGAPTPAAVKEQLLALADKFDAVNRKIKEAKDELDGAGKVEGYDNLIDQVSSPQIVVVVGPKDVRVIPLKELFREPDRSQMRPGQMPELRFQGEEKITGALVSMSMSNPPMVVFVGGGPRPATGPGGQYQKVTQRLQNLNFKVESWNPAGGPGPGGRPMPPGPAPEPQEGQKAVWIVLPQPPPNPQNPMASGGNQQLTETIRGHMTEGHGVMFMLSFNPMPFMGGGNELAKLMEPWGITAQTDRAILAEIRIPNRPPGADYRFDPVQWPADLPVTGAISGMRGHFELPSPLVLTKPLGDGSMVYPLVELRGKRMWAATDLQSNQRPVYDPQTAKDSFVIAAAAEKDGNRIVAATASHDPRMGQFRSWASDGVTDVGVIGMRGTADAFGAMWPANAELFVNSVFWLAGLEDLIAASARSQDIRRIDGITQEGIERLRWSLLPGLPIAIIAVGIGVWLVRRKG